MPKDLEDMFRDFLRRQGRGEPQQFPQGKPQQFQVEPQQFGGNGGVAHGKGSGFVYDDKGHIVTNNHVVEGADKIIVQFSDGEEFEAKVVGVDPKADIAVISVPTTAYQPLPKGKSSSVRVGEWVLAIGSPFGFDQTVTSGIISAIGRNNVHILGEDSYEDFNQTDAAINPGNSGGPLVDLDGKVIGINAAIATSTRSNSGVGFAIPIDMAALLADRLIKDGKITRAMIGLKLQPMTQALAKQFGLDPKIKGVLIESVIPDSPGDKAGLKSGDVIISFNGVPARTLYAFRNLVSASEIGKEFELVYFREGQEHKVKVTLVAVDEKVLAREGVERPDAKRNPRERGEKADLSQFGLAIHELTPDIARQLGYPADAKGVVISEVKEGSPADATGLQEGMLITMVVRNGKKISISSVKQFQDLASKADELGLYAQKPNGDGRFFTLTKPAK
jgi:serine protease Do